MIRERFLPLTIDYGEFPFDPSRTRFVFGLLGVLTISLFVMFHDHGFDDPFITYRYAYNVAHGDGFVYNPGERTLSTTTPLYTLLMATVRQIGVPIPITSNALGCLSLALGGLVFWQLGRRWHSSVTGLAGLLLYPTFPFFIPTLGAETTFYVALILVGVLAYARRRYVAASTLLAAATLTRADAVLAAGVLALDYLLRRRDAGLPWRAIGTYVVLLLPWFGFAWSYFGSPLPVTLAAKQQQAQMAISESFFEGFGPIVAGYWNQPRYRLHVALVVVGAITLSFHNRRWLIVPIWSIGYFVAYSLLGVSRYFWYYAPLIPGVVVLLAVGTEGVRHALRHVVRDRRATGASVLLVVLLVAVQINSLWRLRNWQDPRLDVYHDVGIWLQANTPEGASVGTLEIGVIGYYAERPMIDFAGLLQPETARQLTPDTTYQDAALWATRHFRPDYLVLHDGMFPRLEQAQTVQAACRPEETFADEDYAAGPLVVYACSW